MLKSAALVVFVMFAGIACNGTEMAGSNGKRESADQKVADEPKKKDKKQDGAEDKVPDAGVVVPPVTDTGDPVPGGPIDGGGDVGTVQPDEVVDGTEVVNDCGRCVERAKILSAQAGFIADITRTYNLGFYKIDPSRNLCDIHFMANMTDKIVDHEGQNSSFEGQVVMYCPCNCNWASTEPQLGEGPFTP